MQQVTSILMVGVGGQGTILASKLLSQGLTQAGYDVKMSEIHGMSQRGGSVSTQIRYGGEVFSPIIGEGEADILVSFEVMETARWISYLKPDARLIINDYRILPPEVLSGAAQYPEHTISDLRTRLSPVVIDANAIALELGNAKAMNVVLLGALVKSLGLEGISWDNLISAQVKPEFAELNIRAFHRGLEGIK